MGRRKAYSRLAKADEIKAAADNWDTWRRKDAAGKRADFLAQKDKTQNPRTNRVNGKSFVRVFGIPKARNVFVQATYSRDSSTTTGQEAETTLTNHVKVKVIDTVGAALLAAPANSTILSRGLAPLGDLARVNCVVVGEIVLSGGNNLLSRITKQPYTYRKRDAVSCTFGQTDTLETYEEVKSALENALTGSGMPANMRTYYRAQRDFGMNFQDEAASGGGGAV